MNKKLTPFFLQFTLAAFVLTSTGLHAEEKKEKRTTEVSVARDILQPLGLPLIASYHKMRESYFFNTRFKRGSPIEVLGDFLLTPSRFLFAGKDIVTVDRKSQQATIKPSFKYQGGFLILKTAAAIITLPISIAGGLLKGFAYLSPATRARHRFIKNCHRSNPVEINVASYKQKGISSFYSEEYVPCQNHEREANVPQKHKIEIDALKEISQLFDKHGILYWVDCGTCLGAYRYGGFIPWDWDIDISILRADHENVKKVLAELDPEKYQIQDWSAYSLPQTFLKLYIKKTKTLIDIYHYEIDENARTITYIFSYRDSPIPYTWKSGELAMTKPLPYDVIFPLRKAHFDGLTVWAPNKIVPFLKSKYGENLDPTMVWEQESQTYKKVPGHPYWNM